MSRTFGQVSIYARRIKDKNIKDKIIYVDDKLNVYLIDRDDLPNKYYKKTDILFVSDPYLYLKEINKREPTQQDLDLFKLNKSNETRYFINRKQIKGYITINDFDEIINKINNMKDGIIDLYPILPTVDKNLCEDVNTNTKILGEGGSGIVFKVDDINDIVVKKFKIKEKNSYKIKKYNGVIAITQELHEMFIATKFSQIYTGLPNGTFNKNFLYYDGFFICPSKDGDQGYIVMEAINETFNNLYNKPMSFKMIKSIIFQLLFAIKTMQYVYKAVHSDLHAKNIMLKNSYMKEKYLQYKFKNDIWYIDTIDYIIKIADLDRTTIFGIPMIANKLDFDDDEFMSGYEFMPGYDFLRVFEVFLDILPQILINNRKEQSLIENFIEKLIYQIYDIVGIKYIYNKKGIRNDFIERYHYDKNIKYNNYDLTVLLYNEAFDEYRQVRKDYHEMAKIV